MRQACVRGGQYSRRSAQPTRFATIDEIRQGTEVERYVVVDETHELLVPLLGASEAGHGRTEELLERDLFQADVPPIGLELHGAVDYSAACLHDDREAGKPTLPSQSLHDHGCTAGAPDARDYDVQVTFPDAAIYRLTWNPAGAMV